MVSCPSSASILSSRIGRLTAFFLLYFTQGLPIGFCGGAVAVYLRRGALGVDEVGAFIAAVYAPWGVKRRPDRARPDRLAATGASPG